ncbi:sensor histidine kinase [Amycolatopsis carbonis]|uniref:histidine kinase n=1 Tax=Amycolatopsis carbonis TaxID=715471 RepID=A0A9Y2IEL7_9PSEU|nr:sensor histidine kinase [Amycolatopsis sp. 2-15]WIX78317.1 sensor histidine kinase [Amycolatopsis sp. 2-15]
MSDAPVNSADHRVQRLVSVLILVLLTWLAAKSEPHPALHGQGLGVLLGLLGVLLGGAMLMYGVQQWRLPAPIEIGLFLLVLASSVTLVWLEPNGTGFFGGFLLAATASARLDPRRGGIVVGLVVATLVAASLFGARHEAVPTLLSALGMLAFYRLGVYMRKLRERTEELEQTRAAQVRAAALAERQRLAREMHDVLAHSLSGLLLHLEGARLLSVHSGSDPRLTDTVERAHQLAQSGLAEARQAIGALRGEDLPGPERLPVLAAEFERDTGIPCEVTVSGQAPELAAQTRLTLYRVAQEALTNVRKHADAERVNLLLSYEPGGTLLTVEDLGRPGAEPGDHGYGVSGMRERAELLGGQLDAAPTGTGFRVSLWAPA